MGLAAVGFEVEVDSDVDFVPGLDVLALRATQRLVGRLTIGKRIPYLICRNLGSVGISVCKSNPTVGSTSVRDSVRTSDSGCTNGGISVRASVVNCRSDQ